MNNGVVTCTDGTNLGSKCTYECGEGFELTGSNIKTCALLPDGTAGSKIFIFSSKVM